MSGSKDVASVASRLRSMMGIPENADIRIKEKDTLTRIRREDGGGDAYGTAQKVYKDDGDFYIKISVTSKRPSVIAHELEHARDMLGAGTPENLGFNRGHHDQAQLITELLDEMKLTAHEDVALKTMFPAEDAAITQAKDEGKILKALASCRLRNE
jgi:hypothetical protein